MRRYVDVLRVPGAAAFSGAGALARLPQAMVGLGALLLVTGLGRSYTLGGLVSGATSVTQALAGPQLSRLADRLGQSHVLWPQLVVHVSALALLVHAGQSDAPGWLLVLLGAVVGAALPQVGAFARARWTALLHDDPRLDRGLAIEALVDEAVFVVGPFLVTLLATTVAPAAGLYVALALALLGCSLFLAQRRTEPLVERPFVAHGHGSVMTQPGLVILVGAFFALGSLFGLIEVGVVALAKQHGHASAAGSMLASWAAASVAVGVAYGAARWRTTARLRFLISIAAMAAGPFLIAASSFSLLAVTVALVVAGGANAPTFIAGNALVRDVVAPAAVTEAYTWVSVIVFAGAAVGTPIGGALVDHAGAAAALWASAVPGCLALTIAGAGMGLLQPRTR
jgi:predicted MFS family arabinose efflux permease